MRLSKKEGKCSTNQKDQGLGKAARERIWSEEVGKSACRRRTLKRAPTKRGCIAQEADEGGAASVAPCAASRQHSAHSPAGSRTASVHGAPPHVSAPLVLTGAGTPRRAATSAEAFALKVREPQPCTCPPPPSLPRTTLRSTSSRAEAHGSHAEQKPLPSSPRPAEAEAHAKHA